MGGGYVLVVKFSGGDYVLVVKFMGGILSTYTKMSRGVLSGGDFVLHSFLYVNPTTHLGFKLITRQVKQNKGKRSLKPDSQMLRGVVNRLIEYLVSMGLSDLRY